MSIVLTDSEKVTLSTDSDVELTINVAFNDEKNGIVTEHRHELAIDSAGDTDIIPAPPQGATRTVTALTVNNQQRAGQNAVTITAAGADVFTGTLQSGDTVVYASGSFTHTTTGGDGHSGNSGSVPVLQHVYDNGDTTSVAPYADPGNTSPVRIAWSDEYPTDDDILDLADPLAPVVRAAGTYAVSVTFAIEPAAGKHAFCSLDLATDSPDGGLYAIGTLALDQLVYDGSTGRPNLMLQVTGRMPAGAAIVTQVQHNAAGALDAFPICMVCKIA